LKNKHLLSLLLLVAFVFSPMLHGFFIQDEWQLFGIYGRLSNKSMSEILQFMFLPAVGRYVPLTNIVTFLAFTLFKLHFVWYALISIGMHLLNVVLAYHLTHYLFKERKYRLASTALFALGASGSQATTWIVANVNTHGATACLFIALILFFKYLNQDNRLFLYLSTAAIFISLLFKEIGIGLNFTLIVGILLFSKKKMLAKLKDAAVLAIGMFIYIVLRIFLVSFQSTSSALATDYQSPFIFLYNFLSFPAKTLLQTIFPLDVYLRLQPVLRIKDTGFYQNRFLEVFFVVLFIILIAFVYYIVKKAKATEDVRIILFSLPFVILNSFVYALSPGRSGVISFIDSRNLYFVSIGTSIFLISFLSVLLKNKGRLFNVFVVLLLVVHIAILTKTLIDFVEVGRTRRYILSTIHTYVPEVFPETVILVESDTPFYGMPETKPMVPFQSGFGHTLLVSYSDMSIYPETFYQDSFLWPIDAQGYRKEKELGFGYFWDFDALSKAVSENNIPINNIVSFRYFAKQNTVEESTSETHKKLAGFFSKKQLVNQEMWSVDTQLEMSEVGKLKDGKRDTAWSSKVPSIFHQDLILDLKSTKKIAQIQIDTFNNQDQNRVGYNVFVSLDGNKWEQENSAFRTMPKSGLVNLYLEPKTIRYVKLQQAGDHIRAPWVIHELNIYEALN
jgi:hypothetical protein